MAEDGEALVAVVEADLRGAEYGTVGAGVAVGEEGDVVVSVGVMELGSGVIDSGYV